MTMLYFDFNATTPMSHKSKMAIQDVLDQFANPSSRYRLSNNLITLIHQAKESVAQLVGGLPERIIFTSGGTESNNLALHSVFGQLQADQISRYHAICSAIEHSSILEPLRWYEKQGLKLTLIEPSKTGRIDLDTLCNAITPQTCFIALMAINNETGVIQPYDELAYRLKGKGIHLHCDAIQAVGKWPIRCFDDIPLTISFSGHKFYAPKGIGGLYYSQQVKIYPLLHGGGQEQGLRSGTENTLGIAGLAAAAEEANEKLIQRFDYCREMRIYLLTQLDKSGVNYHLNGETNPEYQVPWTLNISFPGIRAEALASRLDLCHGISVSLGSACSNNSQTPQRSHVLLAMQSPHSYIDSALRISFGHVTGWRAVNALANALQQETQHLLAISGEQKI
ncbi:cysteine desulfurase [Xenorhabdus bovienii]|uniref:cysteine desulfurase family protein n=1 Tax=Xenorhabdus bovienii TaxID=40576 RepID=UPI0023B2652A|nr:cysteine desulfurase family protein [Xenorhabdus bovienii]MDE9495324.1 cysteine desulfurase [Xenorhabdus bovienii]MDE9503719.1 cysteine desulfurase [Xenorhabdus bovienii]MDE9527428.1 cysteine desulfurase [Xenorhabdus bovienii]MDE9570565.1 cysteine desulfurase [Xenorhabdus bovienii]